MDYRLIDLDCPACGSAMTAGQFDVLFFCAHCGSGAILADDGLEVVTGASILPAAGRRAEVWKPAWMLEVDAAVDNRRVQGGTQTRGWAERRRYLVPAFDLPLTDLRLLANALSQAAKGDLARIPSLPCHGGVLSRDDALVFVRDLIVGAEVARPDNLATLEVRVNLVDSSLVALPFARVGPRLTCSITGTTIRTE